MRKNLNYYLKTKDLSFKIILKTINEMRRVFIFFGELRIEHEII